MNTIPNRIIVEKTREQYPVGTVVILDKMADEQAPPVNTPGIVTSVDDIGTIHVDWLTGSTLGVAYPVDECHIASPHEAALYYIAKESKRQQSNPNKPCFCLRCGEEMDGIRRHALSRRADVIICDSCGTEESIEDAVKAGVMKGEDPLTIEEWYVVKKNTGARCPYYIKATEEIENGEVVGYTVTVPEKPEAIGHCEHPDEIIPTGEKLMEEV